MARSVQPEILDDLLPSDPRAIGSRRDLNRINRWMMQRAIMARLLSGYGDVAPNSILELGSGDGTFMLAVARKLVERWPHVKVRLVDRVSVVTDETLRAFSALGWEAISVAADVMDALDTSEARSDIACTNLFLHHFEADALRAMLAKLSRTVRFVAACEPRRSTLALAGSRMVFAIGCNDVSRHDAVVSVKAGFSGTELSTLWPSPAQASAQWQLEERAAGLFTHTFTARQDLEAVS